MNKNNYNITKKILLDNMGFESDPELLELFIDKLCKKLKVDEFAGCQPIKERTSKIFNLAYNVGTPIESQDIFCDSLTGEYLSSTRVTLEIISSAIEASYQKFKAIIDLDAMERSHEIYGDYMQNQYINFMATEVAFEIHMELLDLMYKNSDNVHFRIDIEKDDPITIIYKIQKAANIVARSSKRAIGNKIILTQEVFDKIMPVIPNFKEYGSDECDIQLMGTSALGNIFVSTYSDVVMVHYKGDSEVDSNIFFSPYAFSNRGVVDPTTFENLLNSSALYNLIALNSNYTVNIQVR